MKISYKKLWKMLIDKNMTRRDLRHMTGISTISVAKMGKGKTSIPTIATNMQGFELRHN